MLLALVQSTTIGNTRPPLCGFDRRSSPAVVQNRPTKAAGA
jgi:hypothetical protein